MDSRTSITYLYTRRIINKHSIFKENHYVPPNSIFRENLKRNIMCLRTPNPIFKPIPADFGICCMLDASWMHSRSSIIRYLYSRRIVNQYFISEEKQNVPPN